MKQGTTLLIVVLVMGLFSTMILLRLNAWEKKIKQETIALAKQTCEETLDNEFK